MTDRITEDWRPPKPWKRRKTSAHAAPARLIFQGQQPPLAVTSVDDCTDDQARHGSPPASCQHLATTSSTNRPRLNATHLAAIAIAGCDISRVLARPAKPSPPVQQGWHTSGSTPQTTKGARIQPTTPTTAAQTRATAIATHKTTTTSGGRRGSAYKANKPQCMSSNIGVSHLNAS